MATCEKREVKVEPPPVEYVLVLSEREVKALRVFVSGSEWPYGYNAELASICEVLVEAGEGPA